MKTIYQVSSEHDDEGHDTQAFQRKGEAIKYAKDRKRADCRSVTVEKEWLTKDAVLRIINGEGGYVERSEVVFNFEKAEKRSLNL